MGIELEKIWMDGKFVKWKEARVHVLTHALHYGTAIFEGIKCYPTKKGPAIFRLQDHLGRLYHGAKIYGVKIPYAMRELSDACKELIKVNKVDYAYIRPLVYLGYKTIGLDMSAVPINVAIAAANFRHYIAPELYKTGLKCKVSSWRRIQANMLSPHVKASANYLNSALAKAEAKNCGYHEAIMLNEDAHVSEASTENVFFVSGDWLYTPPLHEGVLAGITRDSIIKIGRELGYGVIEQSFFRDELFTADEVFLTGTAAEIVPVVNIDGVKIGNGKPGKTTKLLAKKFDDVVHGRDESYHGWLEFVNK
jgi:branched-chain amino acid aminotransferase